jgi:hypothetical protein
MKKIKLFLVLVILTISSCQKEKIKQKIFNRDLTTYIDFSIEFPDTVYLNKSYDGKITYRSGLDSIITSFGDKQKNRYTRFIIAQPTIDINYDIKSLREKVKDTFGALNNRTIPFYDVKFSKLGVNYIDGLIDDIVLIDTVENKKNGDPLPLLRNEARASHRVIVIQSKK